MTDLEAIIDGFFGGGTVPTAFYIGLVNNDTFVGFDPTTDTMSSHAGWTEFTSYDEATRQAWTPGAVGGGYPATLSNPLPATYTISAAGNVIGIFLCDVATKGGTTGQLYGPWFLKNGSQVVVAGKPFKIDTVKVSLKRNSPWTT